MTDDTTRAASAHSTNAASEQPSKAQLVVKLLSRKAGATLVNLTQATGWQPHSARAHLTGLRKQGTVILREKRKDGTTCWRIAADAPTPAPASIKAAVPAPAPAPTPVQPTE